MKKTVYLVWYTYASAHRLEGVFASETDAQYFINLQDAASRCLYEIEPQKVRSYR